MKLRYPVILLTFAVTAAFSGVPAQAVAPKEAPVVCDLKAPLQKLAQLKEDDSEGAVEQALELRRTLLHDSMDCNAREAVSMASSVSALQGSSRIAESLKRRYASELGQASQFAGAQRDAAAALTDVEASKAKARDLRAWREGTYNPLAWEASQLIVLDRNLQLIESAEDRLAQLRLTADELAAKDAAGTASVKDGLEQADDLIVASNASLDRALSLLKGSPKTAQEEITSKQKEGLDGLSRAYELLLESNASLEAIAAR